MNQAAFPCGSEAARAPGTREGFHCRHTLQVRFRDCDSMGHVNNAVYFTYLEEARFAYWREAIRTAPDAAISFIVARNECDYKSPAVAGECLEVWVRTGSIGRSSFVLEYEIVAAASRLVARARSVQVMYDYTTGRSQAVPDDLASTLERYEGRGLRTVPRRG